MRKYKDNYIKNLYKYVNIYYGFNKYSQQIVRASWGISLVSNFKYNLNYIIDLEKFLLENFYNEDFIKNLIIKDVSFFKDIKNYKGFRFLYKLPVRGQRTKTNRQTFRNFKLPLVNLQDLNFKIKNKLFK